MARRADACLQPLLLTLCNEHGDEIASATAARDDVAVKSAILLLARSETLPSGDKLTVTVGSGGALL